MDRAAALGEDLAVDLILRSARTLWPSLQRRDSFDLAVKHVRVQGRRAFYATGGDGPAILFLHGWGLGHQSYRRPLRRLTAQGHRVYAPAMPGFGGTADLPLRRSSVAGYAAWVDDFLAAVGVSEPVLVVGHSFGGGVAIKLADRSPERVRYLVVLNSVGGAALTPGLQPGRSSSDYPMWDWATNFWKELAPTKESLETVRAMSGEFMRNMLTNPWGVLRAAELARSADLTAESARLRARKLPVLALSSDSDGIVPQSAFESLCAAMGTEGRIVQGHHSWLLSNPDSFGQVLSNVFHVQSAAPHIITAPTGAPEITRLLAGTQVPAEVVAGLLAEAPPLWLVSEAPAVLAGDLALCYPALEFEEVRAVARHMEDSTTIRLTVVAADRPGLLADTAAVLATEGVSVLSASAGTWGSAGLALHALTFDPETPFDAQQWEDLGHKLQRMGRGEAEEPSFVPAGQASVSTNGEGSGRSLVDVSVPDQPGLLWAICRWFADHGISIEAASASTTEGIARDGFIVVGECDVTELAAHLTR
jgi:pimeloyl-ACP methyl ester carboxylesterase/predicted amino acid-binding ACT domain protein